VHKSRDGPLKAKVIKIVLDGPHGSYAMAIYRPLGTITFSLGNEVWEEETLPDKGVSVKLDNLIEKSAGWRALSAKFWRLSDEETSHGQQ